VELRFYALFALFVVLPGANRQRIVLFCAVWTLAAAVTDAANQPFLDTVLIPEHAPYFIGGIGLYLVHRNRRDMTAWGIVAAGWLIGQHYAVADLWHPRNSDAFSYRSSIVIIAVITFGFVAVGAVALNWLDRADWRWLTVAGALTYPFYLVHERLGWVTVWILHRDLGLPSSATLPLTIGAMLLVAWLLHRWVERPLTPRIKRALTAPAAVRP
jgi:peptidoglycan/LPS O-acetylase OafA/YrhL